MARKKTAGLTEGELRLMEVLWRKKAATVQEIAVGLPRGLDLAYNTVLTTMRILEDKGYVQHVKPQEGRAFIYKPVVSRGEASRSAVRHLLDRFFGNSAEALVLNLLEDEEIDGAEMARIRKVLGKDGRS